MNEEKKFSSKMATTLSFRKAYAKQLSEGTPLVFVMFGEPSLIDESALEKIAKEMDLNLLQLQVEDQAVLHFNDMLDTIQWLKEHPITSFPFHALAMNPEGEYIADNSNKENLVFMIEQIKKEPKIENKEKEESNG
jgi:hypothetical protein